MRKIFTPVIYVIFLLPLTGISVGVEMIARETGILGEFTGIIDTPTVLTFAISITILGFPLFWLANILMQGIEKLHNPNIYDFIRQSVFFFFIIIYAILVWIFHGFSGNEEDGYLLLWLGISLVAVLVNYIFLFSNR